MRKFLTFCQCLLAFFLAVLGMGCMYFGIGGLCLVLALLVAPLELTWEMLRLRWFRWLCIGGILLMLSFAPLSDVNRAGYCLGWRLWTIWQGIASVLRLLL